MTVGQAPAQKPVMTAAEMDGRIMEIERQRNEALTRCATLSGMNALLRQTLTEASVEIERLNGLVPLPADSGAEAQPQELTAH